MAHDLNVGIGFGYLHYTSTKMLEDTRRHIEIGEVKKDNQEVPIALRHVSWQALDQEVEKAKGAARTLGVNLRFMPDLKGQEIERRFADDDYAFTNKCLYPWSATRVNPYGIVYPCSINIAMGSIRERTLEEIWNGEPYARFRRTLRKRRLFAMCAKCCALNDRMWNYLPAFPS